VSQDDRVWDRRFSRRPFFCHLKGLNMFDDEDDDVPGVGHNSGTVNDERLLLFFQRVERLEEEKKGISDDIKDVWLEAKAVGYDAKIAKATYKLWKMDADARREQEMLLETYCAALGL
jgi:uncharacterized protein (UPF0335 family)